MKKIKLTKNKYVLVDDEDYPYLSKFKWQVATADGRYYAVRRIKTHHNQVFLIGIEYFILPSGVNGGSRVEHINYNSLDCRKENLTFKKNSISVHHKRKTTIPKTSIYKGVHLCKANHNWIAKIGKDYKSIWIGSFDTEKEAAKAYNKKAIEIYGEFAYQNVIE